MKVHMEIMMIIRAFERVVCDGILFFKFNIFEEFWVVLWDTKG